MSASSSDTIVRPQKYILLFSAALVGFGPASIDMYLPSFLAIAEDLGTSYDNVQLTLSVFLFGFAAGPLVAGPLSDRFGRKPVLLIGLVLFSLTSALCAISSGIEQLIAFRFLQALGGCAGHALGRAILRDVYSGTALARAMSLMMLVMAAAPMVAPMAGSLILEAASWEMIFITQVGLGLACLVVAATYYRETLPPERRQPLHFAAMMSGYGRIFTSRRALGYVLTGGMGFASMFAYISGAPGVFMGYYGVSPTWFSVIFAINIAGFATGSILNTRYVERQGIDRVLGVALAVCTTGSIVLCALVWINHLNVYAFTVLLFAAICAMHIIFANAMAALLNNYPSLAGTASALFGAAQFGFGAIAGLLVGQFFDGSPKSMVTVMAVTMTAAFLARWFLARKAGAAG